VKREREREICGRGVRVSKVREGSWICWCKSEAELKTDWEKTS
jgi:hypothetical protein